MRVVNISEVEKLLNSHIKNFKEGGEMKSMAESIHDERFAAELEKILKSLKDKSYTIMQDRE